MGVTLKVQQPSLERRSARAALSLSLSLSSTAATLPSLTLVSLLPFVLHVET